MSDDLGSSSERAEVYCPSADDGDGSGLTTFTSDEFYVAASRNADVIRGRRRETSDSRCEGKRLRPNDPANWIWSDEPVHEPLIDPETFAAVQDKMTGGTHARVRRQRGSQRPYVLRGLITCARCGKRLEGDWRHSRAFYRCRLADPAEYARSSELEAEHPRNAYVREDRITTHIDGWLARLFDVDHIDQTLDELAAVATTAEPVDDSRAELTRRRVAEADQKIARYKAALEAGTDPALVAGWISEAQAERTSAQAEIGDQKAKRLLGVDDIEAIITEVCDTFGDIRTALGQAEGPQKAELLTSLGVAVTFDPMERTARITCSPPLGLVRGRVGGGTRQSHSPRSHDRVRRRALSGGSAVSRARKRDSRVRRRRAGGATGSRLGRSRRRPTSRARETRPTAAMHPIGGPHR